MHVLHIDGHVKHGRKDEFLTIFNSQILPVLKQQPGFIDEILLFEDSGNAAVGISVWQSRNEAEQYLRNVFDKTKSHVVHLLEGKPNVRSFEMSSSETFHITARKAA